MEFLSDYHPDALEVLLFIFGVGLILGAAGVVTTVRLGSLDLATPTSPRGKALVATIGAVVIVVSLAITSTKPEWTPQLHADLLYRAGGSGNGVEQVLMDGADTYFLLHDGTLEVKRPGEPLRTLQIASPSILPEEMAAAGGVIYLRDVGGSVYAYLATAHADLEQPVSLSTFDDGTNTKQIVSVGDRVWVLKESGEVWKIDTVTSESGIEWSFQLVDNGTDTHKIVSAGSGLYVLKEDGQVWAFWPLRDPETPFFRLDGCGRAHDVAADGRTLYLVENESRAAVECTRESVSMIAQAPAFKQVIAAGGIVYILANTGEVFRYDKPDDHLTRLRGNRLEAGDDNKRIYVAPRGFLAIKQNGDVWRYTEFLSRHQ